MKILVLLGSARKLSDTRRLVELVFKDIEITLVDLLDYQIAQYNYAEEYSATDDFLQLVELMLQHKVIVLATPVYWYAMSGYMKVFFDRFTDIVSSQKHLGRRLKGKQLAFMAISIDEEIPEGFEIPFKHTANYLDMEYAGYLFVFVRELNDNPEGLQLRAREWVNWLNA